MSGKAIFVKGLQWAVSRCVDCPFRYYATSLHESYCDLEDDQVIGVDIARGRPSWCPLDKSPIVVTSADTEAVEITEFTQDQLRWLSEYTETMLDVAVQVTAHHLGFRGNLEELHAEVGQTITQAMVKHVEKIEVKDG